MSPSLKLYKMQALGPVPAAQCQDVERRQSAPEVSFLRCCIVRCRASSVLAGAINLLLCFPCSVTPPSVRDTSENQQVAAPCITERLHLLLSASPFH